jgi:hypothetical protein
MAHASKLDMRKFPNWHDTPQDTPFRVITHYDVYTDGAFTRIDIKLGVEQYVVGFYSSLPIKKEEQANLKTGAGTTELITPGIGGGVEAALNVKANKAEILRALKELVKDLENDD